MQPLDLLRPLKSVDSIKLSIGCPILDSIFGGGVPVGSITEFVSESGGGKTQLALQLALNAQLPPAMGGLGGHTLYICSDGPFPFHRLRQMATLNAHLPENPLDRVLVHQINCVDEFQSVIARLVYEVKTSHIKLVIVDSIAAVFRGQFNNCGKDLKRRQNIFFKVASTLKRCAYKHGLAVVTTNEVVDKPDHDPNRVGNEAQLWSSGRIIAPALGLSWANCVNTRLAIVVENISLEVHGSANTIEERRRILKVVFAPHLGNVACDLSIDNAGVFGI